MKSDRQDLPAILVGSIVIGPARRIVVSVLPHPRRCLVRLASERELDGAWIPSRGVTMRPGEVDQVIDLLRLARERALRPEPALAGKR